MLAVALPSISAELGGTAVDAFWAATSFLLAAAVFQPLWSAQKERSLAATIFLLALVLFTLGTALALMARSFVLMMVARCIQGTGAGGLIALTYVIIADFPAVERAKWFGVVALQWAVGTAAGPIIGGTIAQTSDWRWIFWINLPICLLVIVCLPIVSPIATMREPVAWKRARLTLSTLDWLGAVVFAASLTALLIALTWGGTLYPWASASTLAPLVLGAAGLAAFAVYNARVSKNPFLQKALFATLSTNMVWLAAVVHGILLYCLLFYFPLYFAARGYFRSSAVITGIFLSRIQTYRLYAWVGWGVTTLGMGLLLLLQADSHAAAWVTVSIVGGAGLGASWSATLTAAQAASDEDAGQSSASMFGTILYAAVIRRPDVAFAASRLARHNSNPGPEHHTAGDQVLLYLRKTKSMALQFGGDDVFTVASDASFADNTLDRRSSQSYAMTLFGGTIGWRANKQSTVTTSTTEAELLALSHAAKEAMFVSRLIKELGVQLDDERIRIRCDNQQTIKLVNKDIATLQTRLRHVDIHNHWLRQEAQRNRILVEYLPTEDMIADGLTKALTYQRLQTFIRQIGLVDISERLESRQLRSIAEEELLERLTELELED